MSSNHTDGMNLLANMRSLLIAILFLAAIFGAIEVSLIRNGQQNTYVEYYLNCRLNWNAFWTSMLALVAVLITREMAFKRIKWKAPRNTGTISTTCREGARFDALRWWDNQYYNKMMTHIRDVLHLIDPMTQFLSIWYITWRVQVTHAITNSLPISGFTSTSGTIVRIHNEVFPCHRFAARHHSSTQ